MNDGCMLIPHYITISLLSISLLGSFLYAQNTVCIGTGTQCTTNSMLTVNITPGDICIGSQGVFNFGTYTTSTQNQIITSNFASPFWIEDLKGSDVGYYTTVQIAQNLIGPGGSIIPASNIAIITPNGISTTAGATNPNVVLNTSIISSYLTLDVPRTLFQRLPGANFGLVGKYETIPSLKLTLPAYQSVGQYQGTLVYTLYEYSDPNYFTFNNNLITAYNGPIGANIIIPDQSNSGTVTSIGMNTFWGKQINSVIIPSSITDIGTRAFASSQLPNVIIPNSVTNIGESAFSNNRLTTLTIPNSVTSIGANAFSNNQISNLTIPNSVTTIGETVFESNRLTTLTIPNSVTSIGYRAFASNQLTSITIPNSVTSIGQGAFASNQLTSFTLPASITTISSDLFTQNRLTSVTIPNSVTTIGGNAFSQNQINNVSIPSSVTSIGGGAFATNQLTSINIPNSVKTIGNRAFATNKLTSITIPNSVTSIGQGAFQANNLTSITIPSSVTSISINAFIQNGPNRNSGNITNFVPGTNQTRNLVDTTWVKQ